MYTGCHGHTDWSRNEWLWYRRTLAFTPPDVSATHPDTHSKKYSRTTLNWDGEPSGYAENTDTLTVWSSAIAIYSMYLRLNLSITPDLKFWKPLLCTVVDPITGYFKTCYFCRMTRGTNMMQQLWFININNSTCFGHLYVHLQECRLCACAYGVQQSDTNSHTVHKTTHRILRTTATTPSAEHHMQ